MVAGGTESPISRIGVAGFAACRALATAFNDRPTEGLAPLRPGPRRLRHGRGRRHRRAGRARARQGARRAHLCRGRSATACPAMPTTSLRPSEDGDGAYRCMRMALKRAGIAAERYPVRQCPRHLDHGRRDRARRSRAAVRQRRRQARHVLDQVGHRPPAGAAGAVEAIFSVLAIRDNVAPPTLNLDNPSVETAIDLVPHEAKKRDIDTVLSNSFGFRGHQRIACACAVRPVEGTRVHAPRGSAPMLGLHRFQYRPFATFTPEPPPD